MEAIPGQPTPERIVLPRIQDVTQMAREVTEHMGTQRESAPEFVLFDLQDAFCHWPVAKEELGNCLAPSANANKAILFRALFRALLFGYKSAPLLMGRLSAAIGRMWQAMMEKGRRPTSNLHRRCPDDHYWIGGRKGGQDFHGVVHTQGIRGEHCVTVEADRSSGSVFVSNWNDQVSKKMTEEVIRALEIWITKGMISMREVRSVAAKLSWMAGICPRLRWAVSVLFAVLKGAVRDEVTGEERRAAMRTDTPPQEGIGRGEEVRNDSPLDRGNS